MIVHLMAPGLARADLDAVRTAHRDRNPAIVADLVCTCPVSIETVEATVVTGVDPAGHGRWRLDDPLEASLLRGGAVVHRRDDRIARARVDALDDPTIRRRALEGILALIEEALAETDRLILTTGPAFAPTPRVVDLADPGAWTGRGTMAVAESPLTPGARDALLGTPGVARVLEGDGLRSWHAPDVAALAVAEPGWTFVPGAAACGRRDLDETPDGAVVMAWGTGTVKWPRAVHDVRIAPTLASVAGVDLPGAVDDALPWSDRVD